MPKKGGFTLVELIIVICLAAILVTIFFIAYKPNKRVGESNDQRRNLDTQSIEQAIKVVAIDSGTVPDILKNLTENVAYAIVQAGGSTSGTYTCTALGSALSKIDISSAISSVMTTLPIDPDLVSGSNDTGYYIKRTGSLYNVEPCSTYGLAATTGSSLVCGDGYCHSSESCGSCPQDCCPLICGNGILNPGETCDDSNTDTEDCGDSTVQSGSYCNSTCSTVLSLNETCDDGNEDNTDACLDTCVSASCGDTYCGNGETCSTCTADCGACTQQYSSDKYPGTATDAGGFYTWTNPNNVKVDDGTQASAVSVVPVTSYYDDTVAIIKADGSMGATNKAASGGWSSSWVVTTYGDSSDKWGEIWTPADINNSNFGLAFVVLNGIDESSNILKVTNFGFSIPESATIDGIIAYIEKKVGTSGREPNISSYAAVDVIHIKVYYTD
ncbi:MAG: type II secretion system protein [Patescibacteria group bacterium]